MKKLYIVLLSVAALGIGAFTLTSCSQKSEDVKITYTNQIVTQDTFKAAFAYNKERDKYSSAEYEVVDYDWLKNTYYDYYSKKLFSENITKWDERANCVVFTQYYIVQANLLYYRANFHSNKNTSRLAIGMIWYAMDPNDLTEGHSIVVALTNKGWIYIDPQLPKNANEIKLTPEQFNTIGLREI